MSDAPLTFTDAIILGLVLGSAFLALLRGCVRETLSVSAWVLSALLTYALYLLVGPSLTWFITGDWFFHTFFVLALFSGLVVVFTLANRRILERVGGERVATWDQILGFCFGFARGLALVAILYQAHVLVFGEQETPPWFVEARLFPIVVGTSNALKVVLPGPITKGAAPYRSGVPYNAPTLEQVIEEKSKDDGREEEDEAGYSKDERKAIDRLVRNRLDPR